MPQVYFRGGPIINRLEAVIVFFGSTYGATGVGDWQTDPMLRDQACRLQDFVRDITASAYFDLLAEYTPQDRPKIGHGSFLAAVSVPFAAGKQYGMFEDNAIQDTEIIVMLQDVIQHLVPGPSPNRGYFVVLPPYVAVTHRGGTSPAAFQGYHDSFPLGEDIVPYAVITHPGANPVIGLTMPDTFQQLTVELSHEMVEMITDPTAQPDTGWYTDGGDEISDVCEHIPPRWQLFHGFLISAYWSNQRQACVVPPEDGAARPPRSVTITEGAGAPCDVGVIENSPARFNVDVGNLPGGPYSYQWTVTGAIPVGPVNKQTLTINAPTASDTFTLQVVVTDPNGCTASAVRVVTPAPVLHAELATLLCEMRHLIDANFRFNPLWDPARDLAKAPVSAGDVQRMRDAARRLTEMTERMAALRQSSA